MIPTLSADLQSGVLADAIAAIAEEAAEVILPYWRAGGAVETKADDSPVTEADRRAEALILARLAERWPGVPAVAEEACAAAGAPETVGDAFWLIDPLDGTRGFVRGGENFTVNIALILDGRPVAGAVVAPALGIGWRSGAPGQGAFRRARTPGPGAGSTQDWTPVRVRDRPAEAEALLSHGVDAEEAARLASRHGCAHWRGMDSSLKFCLIADGRFDVYPRTGPTSEWDTAAGQAVLEAAGGRVLTPDGQPLAYGKPGFLNGPFVALGG